jgi:hypothetical protein
VVSFLARRAPSPVEAGTAVRLEIEDLVREAELVLEGRVLADHASRDSRGLVSTSYTLSVRRTFRGAPQGTRVVTLPGGTLPDGSGTLLPGLPRLEVGEDVLLFLSSESANGSRMPVGLSQGKFRVVRTEGGAPALARTHVDLWLVDPVTGATAPAPRSSQLDYAAVVARIEAASVALANVRAEGR